MFQQQLSPAGSLIATGLVALVPVVVLLLMLAVFRISAWKATLIGSVITFLIAWLVWGMPADQGIEAYLYGSATGVWNVDWITFWGVMLFNTLVTTGVFDRFRRWLLVHGTPDVRAQTILFAWAFGALLEGLVGFGFPWAVVAPILISLGIPDLDALRVAAIANNAPVSYGALGAPIIALAAVTGLPLLALSGSVGHIVAILALLPPWILLYLVSGWQGVKGGWPLAIVGSLGYIAGQFPVSVYLGPYLPDVAGAIVCFVCVFILLKVWKPTVVLGYGGKPLSAEEQAKHAATTHGLSTGQILQAWMPFVVLIIVVVLWTGPWSSLPKYIPLKLSIAAMSSVLDGQKVVAAFNWAPGVAGSAILASWILIALLLRVSFAQLGQIVRTTLKQMWGALLVGFFIFGLAYVFNFSGMASSLAYAFSKIGWAFIIVSPILGWIGVALSGSNTSTNAMFGAFQAIVGKLLGFPVMLLPTLNSVGAEIGKPVAPQTASVGVSTTQFVRNEGVVIRHNMGWTFFLLAYLILIGIACYFFFPNVMALPGS
ncbi:MAG: L-lactate permease [Burkholderiaceae bacterium]|jgi:lactate permease